MARKAKGRGKTKRAKRMSKKAMRAMALSGSAGVGKPWSKMSKAEKKAARKRAGNRRPLELLTHEYVKLNRLAEGRKK